MVQIALRVQLNLSRFQVSGWGEGTEPVLLNTVNPSRAVLRDLTDLALL